MMVKGLDGLAADFEDPRESSRSRVPFEYAHPQPGF
jgi:hypothetical protein